MNRKCSRPLLMLKKNICIVDFVILWYEERVIRCIIQYRSIFGLCFSGSFSAWRPFENAMGSAGGTGSSYCFTRSLTICRTYWIFLVYTSYSVFQVFLFFQISTPFRHMTLELSLAKSMAAALP